MQITNVRIHRVNKTDRLCAFASITIDDCFVVHNLRIIDGNNGLFVAMPSYRGRQGQFLDVAHPIDNETRTYITQTVIEAYEASDAEVEQAEDADEEQAEVE